jgi:hypothetical protein
MKRTLKILLVSFVIWVFDQSAESSKIAGNLDNERKYFYPLGKLIEKSLII